MSRRIITRVGAAEDGGPAGRRPVRALPATWRRWSPADATDPATGQRYPDVIMFWVDSEADKQAMVRDEGSPFFTTAHFDGHPSVLIRGSRIGELTLQALTEVVQDAWLCRASATRSAAWLRATR